MAALITDNDIAYLSSLYPLLDLNPLSGQEEQALMYYLRGQSLIEASRAAGYRSSRTLKALIESEEGKVIIEHLREREFTDVRITVDTLTSMFLTAYHQSATAAEMVAATRELGKLHGIYPDQRPRAGVEVTINNIDASNHKQFEKMSDAKLLELAPSLAQVLEAPKPITGERIE